jgi:predicted DNA-binding protein
MPNLTPDEEAALDARLTADADDPDAWEELPAAAPQPGKRFGSQISLRLPEESSARLAAAAAARGVGTTMLARELIEEGLRAIEQGHKVLVELVVESDGTVRAARVA